MKYKTIALIVAAGSGQRAGAGVPKQYRKLGGVPMLRHSVKAFLQAGDVDAVRVVYNPADKDLYEAAVAGLDILQPVAGGKTRQESVRLGLESLEKLAPEKVLIHDAARPLLSQNIIARVLEKVQEGRAVIPALPVEDTLKKCEDGKILHTVHRADLMRAQTPQGFYFSDILKAHREVAGQEFTDDAAIAEVLGGEVETVEGSQLNFKVTTEEDFERAERLMGGGMRVGSGFDVHKFCAPKSDDNKIMLCGVAVPCAQSLEGHSDADVGLHAVVDAILGAIAAGDIGEHFPPSDNKFKGMDSAEFLRHADKLLKEKGGKIANIDVTIICEMPKLGAYKKDMAMRIADILGIDASLVNVKATTTEGLGFTGRGEGIAAQAVALVSL